MADDTEGLAQFNRFLGEARALPKKDVATFRLDPVLVRQNVIDGVSAVRGVGAARLSRELPGLEGASLDRAEALALAVAYAVRRAENAAGTGVLAMLAEASGLRDKMLSAAETLAKAGVLSAPKVAKIRSGSGKIDAAKDCVDLAALFTAEADAVRGKSPISAAEIRRAGQLGAQLLDVLKPKGSKRDGKSAEAKAFAADRDAMGSLLASTYDTVRRAGGWLFGDDRDDVVPTLGARRNVKKKAKPARTP